MENTEPTTPQPTGLSLHKADSLVKRGIEILDEAVEEKVLKDWMGTVYRGVISNITSWYRRFLPNEVSGDTLRKHEDSNFQNLFFLPPNVPLADCICDHDCFRIDDGFVLDYVYAFDGLGGEPLLYARKKDEKPLSDASEYYKKFSLTMPKDLRGEDYSHETTRPFLVHINNPKPIWGNRDEEFYFRFAAQLSTIRQYYLYGDSITYNRWLIFNESDKQIFLEEGVGIQDEREADYLRSINIQPTLHMTDTYADITFFSYKYGVGYSFATYRIVWPNIFLGIKDKVVLPSNPVNSKAGLEELRLRIMLVQLRIDKKSRKI